MESTMHSITIRGATIAELRTNILNFIGDTTTTMTPTANIPRTEITKTVAAKPDTEQLEMDFMGDMPGDGEPDADYAEEIEIDLKADVIPAFRAYAKRHTAKAAAKILSRFKVKSVNELKTSDYPKVMELIG